MKMANFILVTSKYVSLSSGVCAVKTFNAWVDKVLMRDLNALLYFLKAIIGVRYGIERSASKLKLIGY